MSTAEIREEVHHLVDYLDDKFLNAVHALLEAYVQEGEPYGTEDEPIPASEMKQHLQEEVEKALQGQYISVDQWHEKSEKWLARHTMQNEIPKN